MEQKFSLEEFQNMLSKNKTFREDVIGRTDIDDSDNGVLRIYSENLPKYLEKYSCKDFEDLQNTLYYNFCIYLSLID